jgi:hypothetical protein
VAENKPKHKKISIKLKYAHDHGGENVPAGSTIEVWDFQAERIKKAENEREAREAAEAEGAE